MFEPADSVIASGPKIGVQSMTAMAAVTAMTAMTAKAK
jgi:hypothetical protein